jgi:hypothetical protein
MSVHELKDALREMPGIEDLTVSYASNGNQIISLAGRTTEVGPMASNEEIAQALANPFIKSETSAMSITGYAPGAIQAKLDALKQKAAERRSQSMAKLDGADAKLASVDTAIEAYAAQLEKEADDALQEFAVHTNGGPA